MFGLKETLQKVKFELRFIPGLYHGLFMFSVQYELIYLENWSIFNKSDNIIESGNSELTELCRVGLENPRTVSNTVHCNTVYDITFKEISKSILYWFLKIAEYEIPFSWQNDLTIFYEKVVYVIKRI